MIFTDCCEAEEEQKKTTPQTNRGKQTKCWRTGYEYHSSIIRNNNMHTIYLYVSIVYTSINSLRYVMHELFFMASIANTYSSPYYYSLLCFVCCMPSAAAAAAAAATRYLFWSSTCADRAAPYHVFEYYGHGAQYSIVQQAGAYILQKN